MTAALALDQLRVTLGDQPVVQLDVHVQPGEVLTLMGPSGSGKSTALAAMIGTLAPPFRQSGRIWLAGRDITALPTHARRIGLMFQDDLLFPHLSVGGNLAFALPPSVRDRAHVVDLALKDAGLSGFAARDPATLSGGQRARVALLRTVLAEPKALLLDEPFSRLDAGLRAQIRAFVFDQARARGLPVVLVTHDIEDARAAGGAVLTPMGQTVGIGPAAV
ncbi:MAG: ABC transporter ATP-binding protein [Rhodobacteraceae bacterium PARR1]|nr:MAG: ABC transporter ATP-binding protein [Rhodobacteraceae bacterium PARR1]